MNAAAFAGALLIFVAVVVGGLVVVIEYVNTKRRIRRTNEEDRNTVGAMAALQRLQADLARAVEERDKLKVDLAGLEESLAAARERDKWPPCACSFDRPGDVCGVHWPGQQKLIEERDAALVLLHAYRDCGENNIDIDRLPECQVAWDLLRSRGLLGGERG